MHDMILNSGRDTLLFAIPSLTLLVITLFRLDQVFTGPRKGPRPQRQGSALDKDGEEMLCDPDGRTWSRGRSRK